MSPRIAPRSLCVIGSIAAALSLSPMTGFARESETLADSWNFSHGPEQPAESDQWTEVSLPHDWSIELPRDEDQPSLGGNGFFQTGIGWYKRELLAPKRWMDQKALLHFEGVYQKASVWLNGELLAEHAYGYTPFQVDLTDSLVLGETNEILVKVDNSDQPNSRWYSGSGIYRPVTLRIFDPIHIDKRDISASTWFISEDGKLGTIAVSAQARNGSEATEEITLKASIIDPDGLPVANFEQSGNAAPGERFTFEAKLGVPHPQVWDLDSPTLYRLVVRSFVGDRQTDREETSFGIRTVEFSAKEGFLLNGRSVELIGANVHHDNGPLGAAEYRDAAFRKAKVLKDAGFNAVRTAHNPPSSDFLDACDQLGLLVSDESFDGWKSKKNKQDYGTLFDENWESDLRAMVYRDRNHPSVVMWSIGNEVYERGKESGIEIAAKMRETVRSIDTTRPVTAGINGLGKKEEWPQLDHLFANLDVVGYNYELHRHAEDHERLPNRIIYSSESYLDDAFASWKASSDFEYVIGDFVWTGIDYLGEAGIGRVFPPEIEAYPHWEGVHYPWHGAYCGDIDLTGFRKPISHYRNIVWDQGEKLFAAVLEPTETGEDWNVSQWATRPLIESWTWPELAEGTPVTVEVFSRYPKARLLLNSKIYGEKPTGETQEFKAVFEIPYKAGKIEAQGIDSNGNVVERFVIQSAEPASQIALEAETPIEHGEKNTLRFVRVRLADKNGIWNMAQDASVSYSLDGPARIAAIGSADLASEENYGANPRKTWQGQALVVIERTGDGSITLTAESEGLGSTKIEL
ncbi:glycoside hydrolase family 2 TIM barrel-domain containing protein [Pelagicoccus albus]|uniref:Glycoside hydrolase family 2 protein n=1 Tax=Pelagicoccus albus TaxID=415222 RepID=A0A7X1B662_9BACT|nr:glycoside hydrolase family 2 TIM barrel-domain containing protein [Pelagicoccus albus]MBC2605233.1 glycoside hydrolase family 2 protein [Pelagicoccus albus]